VETPKRAALPAMEYLMPEASRKKLQLEIPLYGLPEGTDLQLLAPIVRNVAASLEEMGVFDQREFEPAHVFVITKGNDL
jgi:hypothetical protein